LSPTDRDQEDIVTAALTLAETHAPDADWTVVEIGAVPVGGFPLPGQLDRWLHAQGADLIAVRRHIHAHPELSGQEFKTAKLIMRRLADAGLSPRLLPKRNGVICDVRGNGTSSAIVALRADLDALPLPDTKDVPYRSTVPNVCHACGHDVHTTVLLGAGLALAKLAERGELPGTVRLIFQPSEETTDGAKEVIAAGWLKGVSAIFGLHCNPQIAAGFVGVRSGPFTAAADLVDVTLRGNGGHTARPHLTQDVVHALSRVVIDVPALLDRRVDPRAGVSMVFGSIRAGEAPNAIPSEGVVRGTVRVLNRDAWQKMPELVQQLIRDAVAGTGVEVTVDYRRGVPPIVNDRMATAVVAGAAAAALGPDRVIEAEVSMGGEDFAFYLEKVPGSMIRLGVGRSGADSTMDIHQSTFNVDERSIAYGVRVMVHTALASLATPTF
jgi:amidohydrolase